MSVMLRHTTLNAINIYVYCCVTTFPGETQYTHLFIPDREASINQSMYTTKIQLDKPICFIGAVYWSVVRDY